MFDRLIESRPPRRRPVVQTIASLVFHLALGAAAIRATSSLAEPAPAREREQPIFLPAPPRPSTPVRTELAVDPVDRMPVISMPDVQPTIDVPIDRGPIDQGFRVDPNQFIRPAWPADPRSDGPTVVTQGTFRAEEVDDPVAVLDQPKPVYPPVLQAAGISGRVDFQFVVDSTGRAEPSSWHVIGSTNRAFEDPAREAILAGHYQPARLKGRPVRQLVAQRISFSIEH